MGSCSEAQSVCLALKLDYFLVSSQRFYGDDSIGRGWIKSYINLEVDTVWLTREDAPIISLPEDVHFICGKMMLGGKADATPKRGTMSPDSAQGRLLVSLSTQQTFGIVRLLLQIADLEHVD